MEAAPGGLCGLRGVVRAERPLHGERNDTTSTLSSGEKKGLLALEKTRCGSFFTNLCTHDEELTTQQMTCSWDNQVLCKSGSALHAFTSGLGTGVDIHCSKTRF